jgi:hypothetical protein
MRKCGETEEDLAARNFIVLFFAGTASVVRSSMKR